MTILLLSAYTPSYSPIGEISDGIFSTYCRQHGYNYRSIRSNFDLSRHPAWSKIKFLYEYIGEADWIFWMDADVLINNPEIKLESFIDDQYNILVCDEPYPERLNTGVLGLRSNQWTKDLLARIWEMNLPAGQWGTWEQQTFNWLYYNDEEVRKRTKVFNYHSFNSISYVCDDSDFIRHCCGESRPLELMLQYSYDLLHPQPPAGPAIGSDIFGHLEPAGCGQV